MGRGEGVGRGGVGGGFGGTLGEEVGLCFLETAGRGALLLFLGDLGGLFQSFRGREVGG